MDARNVKELTGSGGDRMSPSELYAACVNMSPQHTIRFFRSHRSKAHVKAPMCRRADFSAFSALNTRFHHIFQGCRHGRSIHAALQIGRQFAAPPRPPRGHRSRQPSAACASRRELKASRSEHTAKDGHDGYADEAACRDLPATLPRREPPVSSIANSSAAVTD